MKLLKKWYVQLLLALIAAGILIAVMIIVDMRETGEEIYKTNVAGTQGDLQTTSFDLESSELIHVLVVSPSVESGWGNPEVHLDAVLTDPNGNVLVRIRREETFGGDAGSDDFSSADYTKKYEFHAAVSGTYTLKITTLSEHVKAVYITIGRRTE